MSVLILIGVDETTGQMKLMKAGDTASIELVAASENVGVIKMFAGSSAPSGYFICDGAAISRTTYAALFAIVGTTYGVGDGSTTFNLPKLDDNRFPMGATPGTTGGNNSVDLSHTHDASTILSSVEANHTHNTTVTSVNAQTPVSPVAVGAFGSFTSSPAGSHDHAMSGDTGSALSTIDTRPKFLGLNFIIKH